MLNKIEAVSYQDFIGLVSSRDDRLQQPGSLVSFLLQNSEYVMDSLQNAKDCKELVDRVSELSAEDLRDNKTRQNLQALFQKVPQFQEKSADRTIQIGGVVHPVHSALVKAQDQALSDMMEGRKAGDALSLGEEGSEEARLAYLKNMEYGEAIPGEHALEVLLIASRDDNERLAKDLWRNLHKSSTLLAEALSAWIGSHTNEEDLFGSFIEKLDLLKKRLPEGREYKTLDRHKLFAALTHGFKGHPAFRSERKTALSESERKIAAKILSCINPAYLQGKHNGKMRHALLHLLRSDQSLIEPVKVARGAEELAYFPIIVASHCERFFLVSLDEESKPCWLSKDIERFPLDLQF